VTPATLTTPSTPWGVYDTKAFAIDAQIEGDVGGCLCWLLLPMLKHLLVHIQWRVKWQCKSFQLRYIRQKFVQHRAELGIVQNVATVQLAYRKGLSVLMAVLLVEQQVQMQPTMLF